MKLLEVNELAKAFNNEPVFKGVSFTLNKGECIFLSGKSGSGKTTLLRCLCMLDHPDYGEILLKGSSVYSDGKTINKKLAQDEIGFVFQGLALWNHMSVLDNVLLPLNIRGCEKEAALEQAMNLLDRLGIAHKRDEHPLKLSGGQRQRLAIARALTAKPSLMLLDEVFSNLDDDNSALVIEILFGLMKSGTALILVSHNSSVVPDEFQRNKLML